MAGLLVKTAALLCIFCLSHPQHGIAWNLPPSPPSPCDSTVPFCGDISSTSVLKCCDVLASAAPADFQLAVQNSGASSCADLTCQLCSAPSTGSANPLICAASLHQDNGASSSKGMSTTAKIALIGLLIGGIILVLGLTCFVNLRLILTKVTNMILSNKSEQNINVNIDSDARAVASSDAAATALALSDAKATATSDADALANLEQRWALVNGKWQLLHGQWIVKIIDGPAGRPTLPGLPSPSRPAITEE